MYTDLEQFGLKKNIYKALTWKEKFKKVVYKPKYQEKYYQWFNLNKAQVIKRIEFTWNVWLVFLLLLKKIITITKWGNYRDCVKVIDLIRMLIR